MVVKYITSIIEDNNLSGSYRSAEAAISLTKQVLYQIQVQPLLSGLISKALNQL